MVRASAFIACWLLLVCLTSTSAVADKGQFTFDDWQGPVLRVFYSRPESLASDTPVVFVMHGVRRNADEYRDQWHDLAMEHGFLLVVPEFTAEHAWTLERDATHWWPRDVD